MLYPQYFTESIARILKDFPACQVDYAKWSRSISFVWNILRKNEGEGYLLPEHTLDRRKCGRQLRLSELLPQVDLNVPGDRRQRNVVEGVVEWVFEVTSHTIEREEDEAYQA